MENSILNAASNPALANKLAQEAMSEPNDAPEPAKIKSPSDVSVDLPGGYITQSGEVLRTAEVRELNGRDEESIAKANSISKAILTIINRGTVKIGDLKADDSILDNILAADRDALALGIYRATFGDEADVAAFCDGCESVKQVTVDLINDIEVVKLADPLEDRRFIVKGRNSEYLVKLPEGKAQRELASSSDKTNSELDTLLLEYSVVAINDKPVLGKSQIQAIGLADRRKILTEIIEKNPGPKFDGITAQCPDCGGEVGVPISIGTLFRF